MPVERARRGPITGVKWFRLLERWSEDYSFQRSNAVSAYLQLELQAVDTGANVLLAVGDYDVAFARTVEADELTFAAPSKTVVDLLTAPGRSPAEVQALLEWMQTHEPDWRH